MEEEFNTGDLLLKKIDAGNISKYINVYIIFKDPIYIFPKLRGTFVVEVIIPKRSTSNELEKNYICISPIRDIIDRTSKKHKLYWRPMKCYRDTDFYNKITEIYEQLSTISCRFLSNVKTLVEKECLDFKINNIVHKKAFIVTSIAAYFYLKLGLMENNIPWNKLYPKYFSSTYENSKFEYCDIADEIELKIDVL